MFVHNIIITAPQNDKLKTDTLFMVSLILFIIISLPVLNYWQLNLIQLAKWQLKALSIYQKKKKFSLMNGIDE